MSNSFFSHIFSLVAFGVLWVVDLLLFRGLNRQWWNVRAARRAFLWFPLVGALAIGLWALGTATRTHGMITLGASFAAWVLTVLVALLIAFPVSGLLLGGERLARRVRHGKKRGGGEDEGKREEGKRNDTAASTADAEGVIASTDRPSGRIRPAIAVERVNRGRRSFVTKAAAAIPAATLATADYGLFSSQGPVRIPEIPLTFKGLHPDLRGLRVLHLTDIHLGYYVGLDDLEDLLGRAKDARPDLVLVSGDIADDLAQLPGALRMIDALRPRHGTFATLGNHEYFQGIDNVIRVIDAGPIPLLRGSGASVKIGGAELYVGGADDPVSMGQRERNHRFLQNSVSSAFDGAPSDAFHILMSHRPEGLDVAAEHGIHFTVAGHTHGAQVGFNGRSVLEPWMRERYLWGHYERNGSQLYTSAGVGHWFPFRLGCPPEAPLYVLG